MQNQNSKPTNLQARTFSFSLQIINLCTPLLSNFKTKILADQLLRAGTSIGANITEGKSSSSKREFIHYYEISLKTANETIYWLSLLRESNLTQVSLLDPLLSECEQLTRILASSILTMKGKRNYQL